MILTERRYSSTVTAEREIVPEVTPKPPRIGLYYDTELKLTVEIDKERPTFSQTETPRCRGERFRIVEVLLQPNFSG